MVTGDDQYLGTPIPDTIPTSLRDLLRARIDRLSSTGREVVQLAAVLGREFRYELLASAVGKDDLKLRHTLREVCATGMLLQRWDATSETFVFKHALVREAAYDSITRPARAGLHRTVASMLRTRFADVEGRQLEILAWHLEGAGDALAAASYWQRAAHRALGRGAHVEAERLLRRALALLRALPETPARLRAETDVLSSLGTVLFSTHGYGARAGEAVFREAQALLGRLGDDVSLGVVSGLAILRFTRSDRTGAAELLPRLEHLAARTDDLVAQITGQALLGVHAFWAGELRSAHEKLTRAIQLYDKPEFQRFARAYGHDGGLFCHAYDVLALWLMGDASRARALEHGMSEIAARSGNPFSRALALGYGACLAYDLGDGDGLLRRADELATLSTREHLYLWLAIAMCAHAWALHLRGAFDEAAAEMRAGLNTLRGLGVRSSYAFFLPPLGAALRDAGRTPEGLTVIDSALAAAPRLLSQVHVPELHRIRGELLDLTGDKDGAEQALRTALETANAQGALAYQLRAAISLATLLQDTRRGAEGGTILSGVYGHFTEPGDTPDLRRASTVLERLR
jgi:tetratricopeptide (TPR) repeat protein